MKLQINKKILLAAVILVSVFAIGLGQAQAAGYDDSSRGYEDSNGGGGYYDDYSYYRPYDNYAKDNVYVDYPLYPIQNYQAPRPIIPFHPSAYQDVDHLFLDPFYYLQFDRNNYEKHQLEFLIKYGKIPYGQYY